MPAYWTLVCVLIVGCHKSSPVMCNIEYVPNIVKANEKIPAVFKSIPASAKRKNSIPKTPTDGTVRAVIFTHNGTLLYSIITYL